MNKLHLIYNDDDYCPSVIALVRQTRRSPALSTMHKRFRELYKIPAPVDSKFGFDVWEKVQAARDAALRKANGGQWGSEPELFVKWLMEQDAGFELVAYGEFSIYD